MIELLGENSMKTGSGALMGVEAHQWTPRSRITVQQDSGLTCQQLWKSHGRLDVEADLVMVVDPDKRPEGG